MKLPYRAFDFTGEYITYDVPRALAERGYTGRVMSVHTSAREPEPVYVAPTFSIRPLRKPFHPRAEFPRPTFRYVRPAFLPI
jgi:hypothetical protein